MRLLWMRHEAPPPPGTQMAVGQVPYDAVNELRDAWHYEDYPGQDPTAYNAEAREVALRREVQVLTVGERGRPIALAQLERQATATEIAQVYVHPDYRGGGRGTAMTRTAIEAAGDVQGLWIAADDEDRPKGALRTPRLPLDVDDDGVAPGCLECPRGARARRPRGLVLIDSATQSAVENRARRHRDPANDSRDHIPRSSPRGRGRRARVVAQGGNRRIHLAKRLVHEVGTFELDELRASAGTRSEPVALPHP